METKGFENVKNQIGYCGIWCGSCMGGNGAVQELTKRYQEIIKNSEGALKQFAPKELNLNELMRNLACVQVMPACPGCKKGGGDPTCKVRICASKKNIDSCSQCVALMGCENFEELKKYNARIKEDLLKIRGVDKAEVIEKWTGELRAKWPHCILLCDAAKR